MRDLPSDYKVQNWERNLKPLHKEELSLKTRKCRIKQAMYQPAGIPKGSSEKETSSYNKNNYYIIWSFRESF